MLGRVLERLTVDERLQHGLPGLRRELAQGRDGQTAKDRHGAVGGLADTRVTGAEAGEDELRDRRLREITSPDQPTVTERPGERQRARAGDERPVEIEERRAQAATLRQDGERLA